ncbi:MAG: S-methyl-5'-thioadenosine phosphorylase [Candidatus Omnitrophota bacterium]
MAGTIGIIGGSGLYEIDGIHGIHQVTVETPFGSPSDSYTVGEFEGIKVVFLPRHGKGHRLLPGELNYRANIYGMKKLGVERIISVSAVGSLKRELKPLDIVIPDQFVDRTNQGRKMTFFGDGVAAHVSLADPVCGDLAKVLFEAGKKVGATVHKGGTYVNMEGPAFSTRAESRLYRSWGMDVIGMTNMAESRLAREAEICYATLACVTDYDCWIMDEESEPVTVDIIIQNVAKNVAVSKKLLRAALPNVSKKLCSCQYALKGAIITARDAITDVARKRLDIIAGRYW